MENEKLDQILNVVLEVKKDVTELKAEMKEVREMAIENRTDFMLTKEYIEKRDREFRKEKLENERYKEEQKVEAEATKDKISELDRKSVIDNIRINKLFALETANMLARQAQ